LKAPPGEKKRVGTNARGATSARGRNRPRQLAEALKDWIAEHALQPGDRLPQEKELIELFKASRGTVREALKLLEAQDLVSIRTGPRGGAYVKDVSLERATELLGNYFFFKNLTIHDIYALRIQLEPELAASLVGVITQQDIDQLQRLMTRYDHPPQSPGEEREQRFAELAFHETLTELCPNPVLAFSCRFLIRLLKELTICHRIYERPQPKLRAGGHSYQLKLLEALRENDAHGARNLMHEHMCFARDLMETQEAEVLRQFLR
jgi:GntR family transcriptional repressor for pyruvate dehydrogenase complex